jgi:hypothetical protein
MLPVSVESSNLEKGQSATALLASTHALLFLASADDLIYAFFHAPTADRTDSRPEVESTEISDGALASA